MARPVCTWVCQNVLITQRSLKQNTNLPSADYLNLTRDLKKSVHPSVSIRFFLLSLDFDDKSDMK